jgi:hypothetical protein
MAMSYGMMTTSELQAERDRIQAIPRHMREFEEQCALNSIAGHLVSRKQAAERQNAPRPIVRTDAATDKQINYLTGLIKQAARKGIVTGYEGYLTRSVSDGDVTKRGISKVIDDVKRQLNPNDTLTTQMTRFAGLRGRL